MQWTSVALAGVTAAIAAQFADWFFFGVWMHGRYNTYPEVWRPTGPKGGHTGAIAASSVLTAVASFGFVALLAWLGMTAWRQALILAAGVWLLVPLPMLLTNTMFMRLDPRLLLPHSLGWLTRLTLCAASAAWLVG